MMPDIVPDPMEPTEPPEPPTEAAMKAAIRGRAAVTWDDAGEGPAERSIWASCSCMHGRGPLIPLPKLPRAPTPIRFSTSDPATRRAKVHVAALQAPCSPCGAAAGDPCPRGAWSKDTRTTLCRARLLAAAATVPLPGWAKLARGQATLRVGRSIPLATELWHVRDLMLAQPALAPELAAQALGARTAAAAALAAKGPQGGTALGLSGESKSALMTWLASRGLA